MKSPFDLPLAIIAVTSVLLAACDSPVALQEDNPHDPASQHWVAIRPSISRITANTDHTVDLLWISSDKYGVSFRVERRTYGTNDYALIGSVNVVPSGYSYQYKDSSPLPVGHTYAYRVGLVGSGGAVTYSYDFLVDVY